MVQQHGPQQWRQPPPRPHFGRSPPICYKWNNSASPVCPHPDCRYQHVCSSCYDDNHVTQKDHKVINCPERPFKHGALLPPKVPPMGRNCYNPYYNCQARRHVCLYVYISRLVFSCWVHIVIYLNAHLSLPPIHSFVQNSLLSSHNYVQAARNGRFSAHAQWKVGRRALS